MQLADLPSRRTEAWKWSDLRAALAGREDRLAQLTLPAGASPIVGLAQALANAETTRRVTMGDDGLRWSGGAGADGGVVTRIQVPTGVSGVIVERMDGYSDQNTESGLRLSSAWTDIEIEEHGALTRVVMQSSSNQYKSAPIIQLNEATVRLAAGATFRQFVFSTGATLSRIETNIVVRGADAKIDLNGLYLVEDKRHADLTSQVLLEAERAEIRQKVRGAAWKGGRGVFRGRFKVERIAQKTDAQMEHNALLLEEGAEVFAKPELEIYADDVQCAHGNTMGQLDEDAIFYLRQRGIPDAEARAMITRAFLIEVLPDWLAEDVRGEAEARIDSWLGGRP